MQNPHFCDRPIRTIAVQSLGRRTRRPSPLPASVNPSSPSPAADLQRRLTAVEARLRALAQKPLEGRTEPDPETGERWDAGQVWAHVAEFIPYWIAQTERVLAAESADPVPFGRTRASADRVDAIERDRNRGASSLWHDIREDLNDLRALVDEIPENRWRVRGLHPTRGPMPVSQIVEEMLVSHLEEHASQLEHLRRG